MKTCIAKPSHGMGLTLILAALLGLTARAQDHVTQRLEQSRRHHEWTDVRHGDRAVRCFVVYPEAKDKTLAVIVIHENKGLTDWVRGVADQLAEHGYLAIAPDLLSGMATPNGTTDAFASPDAATRAIYELTDTQVTADLNAVAAMALKLPACNGKLAVAGFCWGGTQSFRFATQCTDLKAAFVFYGGFQPAPEALGRMVGPVYGFYGEDDARVNATLPATETAMKAAGKTFEPVTYADAGHGFMRSGEDPAGPAADRTARAVAWKRWLERLGEL